jgi:hypothetical protein
MTSNKKNIAIVNTINIRSSNANIVNLVANVLTANNINSGDASLTGNLITNGNVTINSQQDSDNDYSGALIVKGGASIYKNLYVGENIYTEDNSSFGLDFNITRNSTLNGLSSLNGRTYIHGNTYIYGDLHISESLSSDKANLKSINADNMTIEKINNAVLIFDIKNFNCILNESGLIESNITLNKNNFCLTFVWCNLQ